MSSAEANLWSIRRRLTVRVTLALGAVLALLFVSMDHWIDAGAHDHLDSVLSNQARSLAYALNHSDPETLGRLLPYYDIPGHTEFFTVYGADARMVLGSSNSHGVAVAAPGHDLPLPAYYDVLTPDGHKGRALAVALENHESGRLLVVATEREAWNNAEGGIHSVLFGGIAVTIVVVLVLVQWMVRSALAPLLEQGARIATMDAEKPPGRVGEHLPAELAPFAAAFNVGIDRLYGAIQRERRFSRDIAHELRTPLAETRLTAEVALHDGDSAALRNGLVTAIAATERMQRSVDTLLALARFESGQEAPALDPLDLTRLAAIQIETMRRSAAANRIALTLRAPAEVWVHSDVGILERILTNLLQNAVDYAPVGGDVNCSITQTRHDKHPAYFICIDNQAPQLAQEDLVHLGTRFWRKPHEGGTAQHAGLGLALAFALARSLELQLKFELRAARLYVTLGPFPAL
ncbi:sensor histidine kinase [Peristeroidobacter agariperforans]|uniref:sensor histidine kinase n=1 Tax=Peristeroidobacter agariperforans TaxID=268404 RepID=UPI00101C75BD|nr:histidine kinase dimerization/phospho-acceptor domain-containing protein [Peristeroidobacter agariperforans]